MTTMQKIIDKLWKCSWPSECEKGKCTCVGRSIYLGDVMARMEKAGLMEGYFIDLVKEWIPCDLSKSLQEIESCGYEDCKRCDGKGLAYATFDPNPMNCPDCKAEGKRHKNKNAQALVEFINSII